MTMPDCDFICVGGGLGGLAGAVRATALGLSCVVLEKSPLVGGVAAYSGGDIWAPLNHLAREAGIDDSRDAALAYLGFVGGQGVPFSAEVREMYVDSVADAVEFYCGCGIQFNLGAHGDQFHPQAPGSVAVGRSVDVTVEGDELGEWYDRLREGPYHSVLLRSGEIELPNRSAVSPVGDEELQDRRRRRFLARGRGLAGGFLKAALDLGVPIHTGADVTSLLYDGERVLGVTADIGGESVELGARRGVLLATGGYGQARYAPQLEGLPEYGEQAPPILDGDHLTLVKPTPAAIVRSGFGYITLGFRSATNVHPGTEVPLIHPLFDALSHPHVIAVNPNGERFGDESVYTNFANLIGAYDSVRKCYRNYPTFAILDDQFRRAGYEFGWGTGEAWPEEELARADSIGELAVQLGLDPRALESTVARFNGFCRSGVDEDFHRGEISSAQQWGDPTLANPNLGAIEEGPFWGCRCTIAGAGIYSHGLSIDSSARVLSLDGEPVPGLYATGNAVAYLEMPGGYQSGVANGRNFTYAFVAATHASMAPGGKR